MNACAHLLLVLAIGLTFSSCTNANKRKAAEDSSILGKLSEPSELDEETLDELKEIANDPNSNLPATGPAEGNPLFASQEGMPPEGIGAGSSQPNFDPVTKWSANGMKPNSVNPGDIYSESIGPVLNKTLSLTDQIPATERNAILSQIASHQSKRFPITFSQKEINALRSQVPTEVALPTRSVALDVKTHVRSVDAERFELFMEKLATGDSGGAISSVEKRKKLQEQLAEVKRRLEKGEELFIVTEVTESEKIRAHYPGAPIGSRDADPIKNAVQSIYPHLTELGATKEDDRVVITGDPRMLWEFEAKALKLENGNVVIDLEASENELAQR